MAPRGSLLGNGAAIISKDLEVSIRTAIQNGARLAGERANAIVMAMGDALSKDAINRGTLIRVNEEIAAGARLAAAAAYEQRNPRRQIDHYRAGAGRVGYGLIGPALADPANAGDSTAFRIVPFDVEKLDAATSVGGRHGLWRQINSGARPASGKKPKAYRVRMDRGSGFILQMPDLAVPAGVLKRPKRSFWVGPDGRRRKPNPEGDDILVAGRFPEMVPLKGSRATQFMDAATEHMAYAVGPAYSAATTKLIADAEQRARLAARGVRVPKRPAGAAAPRFFVVDVS